MTAAACPIFYEKGIARGDLVRIVAGAVAIPAIETIDFLDEAGGTQERQLALPYLPGMDEIALTAAELAFRAGDLTTDITGFSTRPGPNGAGVVLTLTAAARLRKIELRHSIVDPCKRLVVRPMQGGTPGPPILAAPPFEGPGTMFGPVLAGLGLTHLGDDRYLASFADLLGTAWLFQVATGNGPTELKPLAGVPVIDRVAIAAAPRNLSVTLLGTPPTPLWSNADVLLPASGEQDASFLPIAQRRLGEALAAADPGALTLPLALRFSTASAARIEVTRLALAGEYRVRPLGADPVTLALAGRPSPLRLAAPAARRPSRASATLTAKLAGRALNAGSAAVTVAAAARGLRATPARALATSVTVAARPGTPPEALVPLASVALRLDAREAAEAVVELRSDVAGRPGAPLGAGIVRQLDAGFADWVEFMLAEPVNVAAGSRLWIALRLTTGSLLWHGRSATPNEASEALVSADKSASWGAASDGLGTPVPLLAQLFHVEPSPYGRPILHLHDGGAVVGPDLLATAAADSPTQFSVAAAALPTALLDMLALAAPRAGAARAETLAHLYSASVLDLVISDALLGYDPRAT